MLLVKPLSHVVAKVSGKATLRNILIVPFVLQIVGAVGLVGYLSWRNGQQAVNDVASQLRNEISDRIEQNLRTYLETPFQILQTNQDIIAQGMLSVKNLQPWELYLWRQCKLYNHVSVIGVGNEQGNYQAAEKLDDGGKLAINLSDQSTDHSFRTYRTNSQGKRIELIRDNKNFNSRRRPWYQAAVKAGKPTWSEIYPNIDRQILNIAAVHPVYDVNNRLEGVLLVTQRLSQLGAYLRSLKIGRTGKAFIIERSGMVVATSSAQKPFRKNNNKVERLRASDSSDTLTQATAKYLSNHFSDLNQIKRSQQLEFAVDGQRQFVQVLPFQDGRGLDWLIVVVVPEGDFMEQINANTYTTILLCIAAFIVATGIGIITARWITKPILRLNVAAKEIAKGKWDKTVKLERSDEVGQLAESFSQMAAQLQASFAELTALNEALRASDRKFRAIFNQTFQLTGMLSLDGILLETNQTALDFGGLQRDDVIGKPFWDCYWWTICPETQTQLQTAINRAVNGEFIRYEVDVLGAENRVITVDFSLKPIFDENGNVEFLIPEGRDISERKQAQDILANYNRTLEAQVAERTEALHQSKEALRESQARLQKLTNTVPGIIYAVVQHPNGSINFEYISSAVRDIHELEPEQVLENATRIYDQIHPDDRASFFWASSISAQTLEPFEHEWRIITPSGKLKWLQAKSQPEHVNNGDIVWYGAVFDISDRKAAELALKQQTELLQTIFDNMPGMVCFYSADIEVQFINQAFKRTLGWSLEELQQSDIMAQCYPDSDYRASVLEFMKRADGTWQDVQIRTRTSNILFTSWANVRLPDGSIIGIGKDITDRKQAEAALKESEQFLRSIYEGSEAAIFVVDVLEDGEFRYVGINPAHERMSGILSAEVAGKTPEQVLTPQMAQKVSESYRACIKAGETITFEECLEIKGKQSWWITNLTPVQDSNGRIYRIIGTCFNISDRKQAEEALRQSEERWQLVLKSINAGIWDINFKTGEVFHSPRWKKMLGYQDNEIENKTEDWLSRVHPDDVERVMANRQAHLDKQTPYYRAEYRLCCKDKSYKWILSRGVALWDEQEKLVRFIGSHEDITERKRAEEALRQSALRERAIATVVQKMRQTLDINSIFSATTEELRQVLNCDRVSIYRFHPDWSGEFVAESVADGWVPLVAEQKNDPHLNEDAVADENCTIKTLNIDNDSVQDTYLQDTKGGAYTQGINYRVTQDIYKAGFTPCYLNLLERFQVRAYIIVPIFCGSQLWGLLATYQNSAPRCWSESQISAVVQIGVQLGVALQQAQLLQHTQQQALALELALDELKRTQAQLIQSEKMSSLGQMVAGVAHEINNPVSFIYGNLTPARHYFQDLLSLIKLYQQTYPHPTSEIQQLASEIEVDFLVEDWQKLIDSIQVGAERIREIVLSLRNFSRLDEQELKAVDIHQGIDSTLLILKHRLKADGTRPAIEVIKNYGQLPFIACYASQLNQVFMNLLSNAIDALEDQPSPRKIIISTSLIQNPDGDASYVGTQFLQPASSKVKNQNETVPIFNSEFVEIRIADNGPGMSEAVKEKIFDPFFTTKPVGSGTGLGLSISYQIIVEKHQGKISCISTQGKGTEFIVKIPANFATFSQNSNS